MPITLESILSYLANSQEVPNLPTASSLPTTGWLIFYNNNTNQMEKISASAVSSVGGWKWIDNSWVEKTIGNTNAAALEVNDIVYFKRITNSGDPLMLIAHRYDGGDPQEEASYSLNESIQT